jgi:acetyl-CoA synthetase
VSAPAEDAILSNDRTLDAAANDYHELRSAFRWSIPERFNIAEAACSRWARLEPDRVCLEHYDPQGHHLRLTYGDLERRSDAVAASMRRRSIAAGDRVALLLPQGFDVVVAHMAIYKLGAIAVPLALLFGEDALRHRLKAAGARAIFVNAMGLGKLAALRAELAALDLVILCGSDPGDAQVASMADFASGPSQQFVPAQTSADTPAMMIFTSGTTGPPKGALHGHRVLIGHLPGVEMHHEFLPQPGDRLWTPADWAWAGGLLNVLLPGLYFGVPVVSSPAQKFDAETAFRIMQDMEVANAFIPPTALRMLRSVKKPREQFQLKLRTIGSGGEALGRETFEWGRSALGITINEFYGQTECNLVLSSSARIGVSKSGAIGRAVPGHEVAIIDDRGEPVPAGVAGQIAVRRPDPVMFLGYWQNEQATREKFIGDWMTTGDQGVMDEEGYVSFFGRDDDVITSSGYRIGPGEIEDCLQGHPAVQLVAAVGKPDPIRTEAVKVYIVLQPGFAPSDAMASEISNWVRTRLSAHEYPRGVAFVDSLPLTTTGKVIRRELRERAAQEARAEASR